MQDDATSGAPVGRPVPGRPPGAAVPPVPVPGNVPGATVPNVAVGEAPTAGTDGGAGGQGKDPDSDASITSPGAYVALAPPGHPDGEVDTRAR